MSNGKRRTGLFGVSGILVAALIIAAFAAMGGIFQAQAKLTIKVMDAPTPLEHLYLTVDWIKIQATDQGWIDLTVTESSFDLLALKDVSLPISEGNTIQEGYYSMIQIHVSEASTSLTDESAVLNVPSNTIKVLLQPNLPLKGDTVTTVVIDLQVDDPNSIAISHSMNLRPVIKSVVQNSET